MTSPYEKMYLISEEEYLDRRGVEPAKLDDEAPNLGSPKPLPPREDLTAYYEDISDDDKTKAAMNVSYPTYESSYEGESMPDSSLEVLNASIEIERENLNQIKRENVGAKHVVKLAAARVAAVRMTILKRAKKSARSHAAFLKLYNKYLLKHVPLQPEPAQDLFHMTPQEIQLPWEGQVIEIMDNSFGEMIEAAIPLDDQIAMVKEIILADNEQEAEDTAREYLNNSIVEISSENEQLNQSIQQVMNNPALLDAARIVNFLILYRRKSQILRRLIMLI